LGVTVTTKTQRSPASIGVVMRSVLSHIESGAARVGDQGTAIAPARLLGALRAFGVMLGGPVLLLLAVLANTTATLRALGQRRRPSPSAAIGTAAALGYFSVVRPRLRQWGATPEEREKELPGDETVPAPASQQTRAVTVDAPAAEVWSWLAQIGQDRGGFYSYQWLENLAGCGLRNADRVHPEWQHREVGETLLLHPAYGPKVERFDPGRALALEGGWYFVIEPLDDGRCRLIARSRTPRGLPALAYLLLLEIPHFVMERRMLLGIKERAERAQREVAG
jgi:hypothetical protein